MCGIIASIQEKDLVPYLINGLKKEEYRGYDSCGLGLLIGDKIQTIKTLNRVTSLTDLAKDYTSTIGIGHTRWATHGKNSIENAHPHVSEHGLFGLVHNGTIYNYLEIKSELIKLGFAFSSSTDSEVIANLFEYEYGLILDVKKTIGKVSSILKGTYALCIIFAFEKRIYFMKKSSPLILGILPSAYALVSDINALQTGNRYIILDDNEYGYIEKSSYMIYKNNKKIKKKIFDLENKNNVESMQKYNYFMEKEINEIPFKVKELNDLFYQVDHQYLKKLFTYINKIVFIASGTSYHACLKGKEYFHKACLNYLASEFYTEEIKVEKDALYILISQSGETMDVLKSLEYLKKYTNNIIGITNVKGSSLYNYAPYKELIYAGSEIAVASTKAYINEVVILYLIANYLNDKYIKLDYISELNNHRKEELKEYASFLKTKSSVLFIAKGNDYYLAKEASLKLKEVSYIHSEAIYAGELKHGTIALIEKDFPVIVISKNKVNNYLSSSCEEISSRLGRLIYFNYDDQKELGFINMMMELFYLAFYTALARNNEVDKPRNLAKSVTVE